MHFDPTIELQHFIVWLGSGVLLDKLGQSLECYQIILSLKWIIQRARLTELLDLCPGLYELVQFPYELLIRQRQIGRESKHFG